MTLELWNKVRAVPETAKKPIGGGRLKGKTDINPVWRLKVLTEEFGVCGIGWRYEITGKRTMDGANGEIACFVEISLFINNPSTGWSEAIPGTGGAMFVTKEDKGLYTSDECFKMALTDALSVACKALGIGADVYWDKDATKYPTEQKTVTEAPQPNKFTVPNPSLSDKVSKADLAPITEICKADRGELVRFQNIYKSMGYSRADDILKKDWTKILDEFHNVALPFSLD